MARELKKIKLKISMVEGTTGGGHGIGTEKPKEGVEGGKSAIGWGNKIHLDGSPFDADGNEIGPGDPAWNDVPKVNNGYIFTRWTWDGESMGGPIGLGSLEDNYGCTPTIKASKRHEDKRRHTLSFYQVYAEGTPQEVKSETITVSIS